MGVNGLKEKLRNLGHSYDAKWRNKEDGLIK